MGKGGGGGGFLPRLFLNAKKMYDFGFWWESDMILPWSTWLSWTVLSEDGRMQIQNHKYKSGAYTPLDNMLNPWWYKLTDMLPRWLAPNLVTFTGFMPLMASYLLCWYYCPHYSTPAPRWLYFFMSGSLFVYQTMDAMDGKQARRINQSTPLGQLFDHGCDCIACMSHHSMAVAVCLPGNTLWALWGLLVLQTSFFMAQWQEHHTGSLYTAWGPVGVTESQYGLMAFSLFAGVIGPDALKAIFSTTVIGSLTMSNIFIISWVIFNFVLMGLCFYTTMTFKTMELAQAGGWVAPSILGNTHGDVNKKQALKELVPALFLNVVLLNWHADVIGSNARMLCLSFGFLFIYLTGQMIVFSMACMPFHLWQPMLVPFALIAFASRVAWLPLEMLCVRFTLHVHTVVVFLLVLFWLLTVISELKAHLKINVLTVTPRVEAAKDS